MLTIEEKIKKEVPEIGGMKGRWQRIELGSREGARWGWRSLAAKKSMLMVVVQRSGAIDGAGEA